MAVGAGVGDLDPAVFAAGELEGTYDVERSVALRLELLVHEDLGLALGVMDGDRHVRGTVAVHAVGDRDLVLASGG